MSDSTYQLVSTDSLLIHLAQPPRLLRDLDDKRDHLDIDVLVASGDFFVTLATTLDQLTVEPYNQNMKLQHAQLEKCIDTLVYLQRHYQITRKRPDYRQ